MKRGKISKEKIIAAFLKVSFDKSSSGTALSDIADAIGIKKASLYNYYENRDAIVIDVLEFCRSELRTLSFPNADELSEFSVGLFRAFDTQKNLEIFSFIDSEKLFDDSAFEIFEEFKISLIKILHPNLNERAEFFVSALIFLLSEYISAKKMMARNGAEIEFSEGKIKALVGVFRSSAQIKNVQK